MNPYLSKKLRTWTEAGLISEEVHERIEEFENRGAGINVLTAALFIGAFTISIGIISIIAANWHEIPKIIKLSSGLFLLASFGGLTYFFHRQEKQNYLDACILLVFGSIIANIALVGQIYHLESHLFNSFALWLVLGTPVVLFNGSKYVTYVWAIFLTICLYLALSFFNPEKGHQFLVLPPLALLSLLLLFKTKNLANPFFNRSTGLFGQILFVGSVVIMGSVRWRTDLGANGPLPAVINLLAAIPLGFHVIKHYRWQGLALLFFAIGFLEIPNAFSHGDLKVTGALYFLLLFALLGAFALKLGNKKLFDLSCLLIAIRIIFIYFEVFGSLLQTGIGLVVSGIFILIVAWLWHAKKDTLWKLGGKQ